jgi:hypothetical protein
MGKFDQNLMAKLSKKVWIVLFILVNIAGCFFLYTLQCLRYAFIGKVDPSLSIKAQHSEAIRFATMEAMGVLLETLIGVLILYMVNRTLTKQPRKQKFDEFMSRKKPLLLSVAYIVIALSIYLIIRDLL